MNAQLQTSFTLEKEVLSPPTQEISQILIKKEQEFIKALSSLPMQEPKELAYLNATKKIKTLSSYEGMVFLLSLIMFFPAFFSAFSSLILLPTLFVEGDPSDLSAFWTSFNVMLGSFFVLSPLVYCYKKIKSKILKFKKIVDQNKTPNKKTVKKVKNKIYDLITNPYASPNLVNSLAPLYEDVSNEKGNEAFWNDLLPLLNNLQKYQKEEEQYLNVMKLKQQKGSFLS